MCVRVCVCVSSIAPSWPHLFPLALCQSISGCVTHHLHQTSHLPTHGVAESISIRPLPPLTPKPPPFHYLPNVSAPLCLLLTLACVQFLYTDPLILSPSLSLSLSLYLSFCLSLPLSISLSIYLSFSPPLSISLSLYLSFCLSPPPLSFSPPLSLSLPLGCFLDDNSLMVV